MEKYPAKFADASHALVLRTHRLGRWLFEASCPIVRRPEGMVAIQGSSGSTVTFTPVEKKNRETGTILNISLVGYAAEEFKVVPFNPYAKPKDKTNGGK